jgi:hypothetical protein
LIVTHVAAIKRSHKPRENRIISTGSEEAKKLYHCHSCKIAFLNGERGPAVLTFPLAISEAGQNYSGQNCKCSAKGIP